MCVCPPPELLPVLGQLERYVTPTLDAAGLYSSRVVLIWVVYYHVLKQTIWLQLSSPSPSHKICSEENLIFILDSFVSGGVADESNYKIQTK